MNSVTRTLSAKPSTQPDRFRWRGYHHALQGLHEYLHNFNAVFFCGADGSGKTTLVEELIEDYRAENIPVIHLTEAMQRSVALYKAMSETLDLPLPRKKEQLLRRLHQLKQNEQFCLVVLDQDAIDSSFEVTRALFRLCDPDTRVSGSVRLVVVRNDYLVLPTPDTPNTAFHQWISHEIRLNPVGSDEIENLMCFICQQHGTDNRLLQQGTDLVLYRQSEGNISQLKSLLLPLLDSELITTEELFPFEEEQPAEMKLIWIPLFLLLLTGVITTFYMLAEPPPDLPAANTLQTDKPG